MWDDSARGLGEERSGGWRVQLLLLLRYRLLLLLLLLLKG